MTRQPLEIYLYLSGLPSAAYRKNDYANIYDVKTYDKSVLCYILNHGVLLVEDGTLE